MSKTICIISCQGEERYRVRKKKMSMSKYIELDRLGPNGWHTLERERVDGSSFDDVARMIDATFVLYGHPAPTKIIPHKDIEPIEPARFCERYSINDSITVITGDVDVIDDE